MSGRIIKIIGWGILGLTVIVGLIFMLSDAPALETELKVLGDLPQNEKIEATHNIASNWSGLILNYSYILLLACAVGAIGFAIFQFILNTKDEPKSAIKPLLVFGALIAIVLLSYVLGSDSMEGLHVIKSETVTPTIAKWVDTTIYGMYIFLGITVIALIYGEVSKAWK